MITEIDENTFRDLVAIVRGNLQDRDRLTELWTKMMYDEPDELITNDQGSLLVMVLQLGASRANDQARMMSEWLKHARISQKGE